MTQTEHARGADGGSLSSADASARADGTGSTAAEAEQRLRLALQAGRMGIWEWDLDSGRVTWSPDLEILHGREPGSFRGTFEDAISDVHPEDRDRLHAAIEEALRGGPGYHVEYRLACPGGGERWLEAQGSVFRDGAGAAQRMMGVCADITARKRAELALHETELRFSRFMEHLPGLAWIKDREGAYLFANSAAEKAFGVPRSDLYGRLDEEIFPPEAAAAFRENDRRALENPRGIRTIEHLAQQDGVHYSLVSKFPIPDKSGVPAMIGGMAIDITDRMKAEEARALLAAIVEGSDDAIMSKTLDGVITSWNAGAERIFGYSASEAVGRHVTLLMPEDRRDEEGEILARLRRGERIEHFETVRRTKDGRLIDVSLTISPVRDQSGRVTGASKIARDISGAKRAEAALRESEQRYRQLMQGLPAAVYTCDAEGRVTLYNEAAAVLWGREPALGEDKWCGSWRTFRTDGEPLPLEECPMAVTLREGRAVRGPEMVIERPDGTRRQVMPHPEPMFDESGALVGAVNMVVDITSFREAERALMRSEARFTGIAVNAPVAIFIKDLEGRYTVANPIACGALGSDEVIGLTDHELMPDDLADELHRNDLLVLATGRTLERLETVGLGDCAREYLSVKFPLRGADGRIEGVCGVAVDVTARSAAERGLRESEERLALTAEAAELGAWDYDPVARVGTWDERCRRHFGGAPRKGFTFEEALAAVHPDDRERVEAGLRQALDPRGSGTCLVEHRTVGSDGVERWIRCSGRACFEDGVAVRLIGATHDVTTRRIAEDSLRESEERFRTMADSAPVHIWLSDPERRATWFNRPWLQFAGRAMHEELGRGWIERVHPGDLERAEGRIAAAFAQRREFRMEYRLRRHDGEYRWMLDHGVPVFSPNGRFTGFIGSCIDVTDEVAARTALEHQQVALEEAVRLRTEQLEETHRRLRISERMASIGTLSAGLGHDMANILLPIRLRLDAVEPLVARDDVREELSQIRSSVEYLQNLSSGLRMLVVDPSERTSDDRTDLSAWWRQASPVLKSAAPPGIRLMSRLPTEPCWVRFAPTALSQAVFNLVQNAIDALRPRGSGTVEIDAVCRNGWVVLSVRDDGPGMTPEVRERCTQPFFTTKTRRMSTGLGLSLVYGMVREAGGTLEIESEPGRGTTVRMTLRAETAEEAPAASAHAAAVSVRDARLNAIVRAELQDLGFSVVPDPASGAVALHVVDSASADGEGHCAGGPLVFSLDAGEGGRVRLGRAGVTELRRQLREAAARALAGAGPGTAEPITRKPNGGAIADPAQVPAIRRPSG